MDKKDEDLATDIDIMVSSFLFCLNIAIYKYSDYKKSLEYLNSYIYENNTTYIPIMILLREGPIHYNLRYQYISRNNMMNEKTQNAKDDKEEENP